MNEFKLPLKFNWELAHEKINDKSSGQSFQYEIGQYVPSEGGVIAHRWLSTSAGGFPTAGTVQNYLVVAKEDASVAPLSWDNSPSPSFLNCTSTWNGPNNFATLNSATGSQLTSAAYAITSWGASTGLSGWYLPAVDELNKLWDNRWEIAQGLTNASGVEFVFVRYWSSTETNSDFAWTFSFGLGDTSTNYSKVNPAYIRAVRQFSI